MRQNERQLEIYDFSSNRPHVNILCPCCLKSWEQEVIPECLCGQCGTKIEMIKHNQGKVEIIFQYVKVIFDIWQERRAEEINRIQELHKQQQNAITEQRLNSIGYKPDKMLNNNGYPVFVLSPWLKDFDKPWGN